MTLFASQQDDDSARLAGYLADLTALGLPLSSGLRALAEESQHDRLGRTMVDLANELDRGATLPAALESLGDRVPAHLRALIETGLRTEHIGPALQQLMEHQRRIDEVWSQLRQTLAYPVLVLSLLAPLVLAFCFFLIPQAAQVSEDFSMELAEPTLLALWLGKHGLFWLIATVVGIAVALGALRMIAGRVALAELRSHLPLFGPLFASCGLAEFTRTLAALVEYGVPLPAALRSTAAGLRDAQFSDCCEELAAAVDAGTPLPKALGEIALFPDSLVALTTWGCAQCRLPAALVEAGEHFEERARLQTAFMRAALPPALFLIAATLVMFLLSATLMPLIRLVSSLTN